MHGLDQTAKARRTRLWSPKRLWPWVLSHGPRGAGRCTGTVWGRYSERTEDQAGPGKRSGQPKRQDAWQCHRGPGGVCGPRGLLGKTGLQTGALRNGLEWRPREPGAGMWVLICPWVHSRRNPGQCLQIKFSLSPSPSARPQDTAGALPAFVGADDPPTPARARWAPDAGSPAAPGLPTSGRPAGRRACPWSPWQMRVWGPSSGGIPATLRTSLRVKPRGASAGRAQAGWLMGGGPAKSPCPTGRKELSLHARLPPFTAASGVAAQSRRMGEISSGTQLWSSLLQEAPLGFPAQRMEPGPLGFPLQSGLCTPPSPPCHLPGAAPARGSFLAPKNPSHRSFPGAEASQSWSVSPVY
uniref:collagen alpha-1(I) chain-like isoform X2 n=2 Tax=Halichoerus grypus TaxID=9711 RepID=UPI0016592E00|nr:collagen alpha-1(I) chain-like isoform X2 [Halichoerus grypus]